MNIITEHPFLSGLVIGLLPFVYTWIAHWLQRRGLQNQVKDLKNKLHTQMEIAAAGSRTLSKEIRDLKKQNENMRISLRTWQQKPGRDDIRILHLYDKALHLMLQRTPGFSPMWENVLREAEQELKDTERGVIALVRKYFTSSTNNSDVYAGKIPDDRIRLSLPESH